MAKPIGKQGLLYQDAVDVQRALAGRVVQERGFEDVTTVAGVDVSVQGDRAIGAFVVMTWPELELVESAVAEREVEFPYVPGLLSFREIPVLLEARAKLRSSPDLLFVDGHGRAHPRRVGVACHLGVELDVPAIGCGKSRLVGTHREPRDVKGSRARLVHEGEVVGYALRTRVGVKPMYVSVGHRIDLDAAVRLVLRATTRFRLPDPVRAAHERAGEG